MRTTIDLSIKVSDGREAAYRQMAARSRDVSLIDPSNRAAGVITDNPDVAHDAVAGGAYALVINPFALTSDAAAALACSGRAMPAHTARYVPGIQQVQQSLEEGQLGEPGLLRIHCWDEASQADPHALTRELDLAIWMFRHPPSQIYALERASYWQAHLGFAGGGMAIIDLESSLPAGNSYYGLCLIGSTGAAYADDHHNRNLLLGEQGPRALLVSQGDAALAGLIDEFAQLVKQSRDCTSLWAETESAIRTTDLVRRAAANHEVMLGGGTYV